MRRLDELHLDYPFAGSLMLRDFLNREGVSLGRRHVTSLMNFPPRVDVSPGRATPSLHHAPRANCKGPTPAAVHLTFAESCSNDRDQLYSAIQRGMRSFRVVTASPAITILAAASE